MILLKTLLENIFIKVKLDEPSIFAQNKKDADLLWEESLRIVKNKGLTLI